MSSAPASSPQPPLSRGERVPNVCLPDQDGAPVDLYDRLLGKPCIVGMCQDLDDGDIRDRLSSFAAFCGDTVESLAHLVVITRADRTGMRAAAAALDMHGRILRDEDGRAARAFRIVWDDIGAGLAVFVLDPNQRLLAALDPGSAEPGVRIWEYLQGLELFAAGTTIRDVAPLLLVSRTFEPAFCERLIGAFREQGRDPTRRLDRCVPNDKLLEDISRRVTRRVLPELEHGFGYRADQVDAFEIVCHRSSAAGELRRDRDLPAGQSTEHRFVLVASLNAGVYEGGELRFPEYGPNLYAPRTGDAMVFSRSLLREEIGVTGGERYTLVGSI